MRSINCDNSRVTCGSPCASQGHVVQQWLGWDFWKGFISIANIKICSYPHLQALEVFVALNCRPLCRTTAASNIKTTRLVFFVTFSLFYSHHSNPCCNHHFVSVCNWCIESWCVLDNIQSVTVMLVVIPGNIHANCTGPGTWSWSSSDNHTSWEALDNQNHTSWHHGKLQLSLRVIAASSMFKFTFSNLIYVWQKRIMCMECVP